MTMWILPIPSLLGYGVEVAYSGQAAIDCAASFCPETILLDIAMPGMDGYAVADQLRRNSGTRDSLIIAVSGYGREADIDRCREAGIDQHLLKPADASEIQEALSRQRHAPAKD